MSAVLTGIDATSYANLGEISGISGEAIGVALVNAD
jgi:hypothetical protein